MLIQRDIPDESAIDLGQTDHVIAIFLETSTSGVLQDTGYYYCLEDLSRSRSLLNLDVQVGNLWLVLRMVIIRIGSPCGSRGELYSAMSPK